MEYSNETHHWQLRESKREIKPELKTRDERGDGFRLKTGERKQVGINETVKQWIDMQSWKPEVWNMIISSAFL